MRQLKDEPEHDKQIEQMNCVSNKDIILVRLEPGALNGFLTEPSQ